MPPSRHPYLSVLAGILSVLAVLSTGCGSSDNTGSSSSGEEKATATVPAAPPGASVRGCEGTVAGTDRVRVTGIGCDVGRGVVASWMGKPACATPADASRFSCTVYRGYRCLGATSGRGVAVSCSRPGSSIAFTFKRGLNG